MTGGIRSFRRYISSIAVTFHSGRYRGVVFEVKVYMYLGRRPESDAAEISKTTPHEHCGLGERRNGPPRPSDTVCSLIGSRRPPASPIIQTTTSDLPSSGPPWTTRAVRVLARPSRIIWCPASAMRHPHLCRQDPEPIQVPKHSLGSAALGPSALTAPQRLCQMSCIQKLIEGWPRRCRRFRSQTFLQRWATAPRLSIALYPLPSNHRRRYHPQHSLLN